MILALVATGGIVFAILYGVVHTVTERRHQRSLQRQWEERERSLDRRP